MELVAVVILDAYLLLEEPLPVQGHLPLDHVLHGKVGLVVFADDGHFLLGVLQVSIFTIESEFEPVLGLRCYPLSK